MPQMSAPRPPIGPGPPAVPDVRDRRIRLCESRVRNVCRWHDATARSHSIRGDGRTHRVAPRRVGSAARSMLGSTSRAGRRPLSVTTTSAVTRGRSAPERMPALGATTSPLRSYALTAFVSRRSHRPVSSTTHAKHIHVENDRKREACCRRADESWPPISIARARCTRRRARRDPRGRALSRRTSTIGRQLISRLP